VRNFRMQWVHWCGLWFAWVRCLSEWECGRDIRGAGAGQDALEGLGRAQKYVIFIATNMLLCQDRPS
jgi:hypothetical protein